MNIQTLIRIAQQMKKMGNYQKAMTPEQQRVVSNFNNKSEQEKDHYRMLREYITNKYES